MRKRYLPNNCADCQTPIKKANKHCRPCSIKYFKGRPETPAEIRFWKFVEKTPTCWIWKSNFGRRGYGRIKLKSKKHYAAHRFSYELHNGKIPKGKFVCHTCDIPSCVRPSHLWVGTPKENTQDSIKKGRFLRKRNGQRIKNV